MSETTVDVEVEVEVDEDELEIEAGDTEYAHAEFTNDGVEISIEVAVETDAHEATEIEFTGSPDRESVDDASDDDASDEE